jgi:hypothetical protein
MNRLKFLLPFLLILLLLAVPAAAEEAENLDFRLYAEGGWTKPGNGQKTLRTGNNTTYWKGQQTERNPRVIISSEKPNLRPLSVLPENSRTAT